MGVDVRRISLADTRALRQRVLRPHQTLAQIAADEPAGAHAVGAFSGERLIAVGIIAAEGEPGVWRVRGMATDPPARGRGAGGDVLAALVRHASERRAVRVWCNARVPARSLYERAGFVVSSEEFVLPRIGPHLVMELVLGTSASGGRGDGEHHGDARVDLLGARVQRGGRGDGGP